MFDECRRVYPFSCNGGLSLARSGPVGGAGFLLSIAAVAGMAGGSMALARKRPARIILGVCAVLCLLAGLLGFEDGFVWAAFHAVSALLATFDMERMEAGGRAHSPAPKETNENAALPEKENRKSVEEVKRQRAEILTLIGWLVMGALILLYIHNDWQGMRQTQEAKKAHQAAQELQKTDKGR